MSLEKSLPITKEYFDFKIKELGELLEATYPELLEQRDTTKAKASFAPSQLFYGSGVCPRLWFYKFQGGHDVPADFDGPGVFNMESGTDAHTRLQKLFVKSGISTEEQIEVFIESETPPVRGYMDAMIQWEGEELPVEIKTSKQEVFYHRQAQMQGAGYQVMQLLLYMHILGKDKGLLFYENRNDGGWLILPILMTEENQAVVDHMVEWMNAVYNNTELPQRPFTKKSKECKGCVFAEICWEDKPGTVELLPLEVMT